MKDFRFDYDKEDDVLYICNASKKVKESVEFSEDIVLDLDSEGRVIGVELFYASEFFSLVNDIVTKTFLENINDVKVDCRNYRNTYWIISLIFDYNGQEIKVQLPPLRKSEYVSPLIASCE